jgi:hypothetical protein
MSSSKYHSEQAKILAGLALSTNDKKKADRFNLAAMEHLERAQTAGDEISSSQAPESGGDQNTNRA